MTGPAKPVIPTKVGTQADKPPADMTDIYVVRDGLDWAHVVVDNRTGLFMAHSSFGTFAYVWTHIGDRTLREFLRGLSYDYFFSKTAQSRGDRYSARRTVAGIRDTIIDLRRTRQIEKSFARDCWNDTEDLLDAGTETDFYYAFNSPQLNDLYDGDYHNIVRTEQDPQCVGFWTQIWPKLLDQFDDRAAA